MKIKQYPFTMFFALLLVSKISYGQTNLLFVGDVVGTEDTPLYEYLSQQGYTITDVTGAAFNSTTYESADAYSNYDVIFISERVGSSEAIPFKTAGFPIPCVTTKGHVVKAGKWDLIVDSDAQFFDLDAPNVTDNIKILVINNADHYITNIYTENHEVTWTTATKEQSRGSGFKLDQTIDGAIQLGSYKDVGMAGFPTLWAIPEGSKIIATESIIPVNIAIFGAATGGLGEFATEDFNTIIKRSLEWVLMEPTSIIQENANRLNTQVFPNPASGLATVTFNGNATSVVLYNLIGEKVAEFVPKENKVTIETYNYTPGIYFVVIENETLKLIIKRH